VKKQHINYFHNEKMCLICSMTKWSIIIVIIVIIIIIIIIIIYVWQLKSCHTKLHLVIHLPWKFIKKRWIVKKRGDFSPFIPAICLDNCWEYRKQKTSITYITFLSSDKMTFEMSYWVWLERFIVYLLAYRVIFIYLYKVKKRWNENGDPIFCA
jgi:hypothetical protein